MELTKEIAYKFIKDFFRDKSLLFLGTGASCAVDPAFGMPALKDVLSEQVPEKISGATQKTEWGKVQKAFQNDEGLESALNKVLSQGLVAEITRITGAFIASLDRKYSLLISNREQEWPARNLLQKLVNNLPEGDRALNVVTPNYDLMMEYVCDTYDIPYINGFVGCVQKKIDWNVANRQVLYPDKIISRNRSKTVYKFKKHIRLYKVHGSLNYFFHNGDVIENSAWMWNPPGFAERVMITPGIEKYEGLQKFREELLKKADEAIRKEGSFLFIGYGFNDKHLEEYINRKLEYFQCPGLIVTKDSNSRIDALLEKAPNLWLVCRKPETGNESTFVYNRKFPAGLYINDKKLWDINEFTDEILGG